MKVKVECSSCTGTGQDTGWGLEREWIIRDCEDCKGTGKIEIEIVDKRKITKKKAMVMPAKY